MSLQERQEETLELIYGLNESIVHIIEVQRTMEERLQRAMNRGLKNTDECLEPVIRLEDGTAPQNFPATPSAILSATAPTIRRWLSFYGLPDDGSQDEKRGRLKAFLGINP